MRRITIVILMLVPLKVIALDSTELEEFDKAVFGNKAEGISPLTNDEMKAYKKSLDNGIPSNQNKDPAYDSAFEKAFPLSPDDVREIKRYNDSIDAEKSRSAKSYQARISSDTLDLSPGAGIQTIRLALHYSCTLSFLDSTGQPWPISSYTPRKSKVFHVTNPEKHPHLLEISSSKAYAQSNMSLTFVGLDSPVVIELISGFSEEVDFKKELHIPLLGPNAVQKPNSIPKVSDDLMLAFLDNIPPENAKIINVNGADSSTLVWEYSGNLYIRSKAWLHLPAPVMRQQSSDGTRVYKTRKAPSLSMSLEGRPMKVILED